VGYGATFSSEITLAGAYGLVTKNSMYLASGQTSTALMGVINFDVIGNKMLSGYCVQADTHKVYLLGYYNNAGTYGNYAFNTGATLANDQWTDFTTIWDRNTGRITVSWGANSYSVNGAGAGFIPDETDFYGNRNGSAIGGTSYFDNLEVRAEVSAVPEVTSTFTTLGLVASGLMLRRRSKRSR
jgi:hypothetical protein